MRPLSPPSPSTSGRAALIVVTIVAVALGLVCLKACNGGGSEAPLADGFPLVRLELEPAVEAPVRELQIAHRWVVTRDLDPGVEVLTPHDHAVNPRGGPTDSKELMLLMRGEGHKRVTIPGPFEPSSFNTVAARILVFSSEAVKVVLRRDGEDVMTSAAQVVAGSVDFQQVFFELPRVRNQVRAFDQLAIDFEGRTKPVAVSRIDLIQRPLESWLPPCDRPAPVDIELESRMAVGISSVTPLEAETIVPPGGRLAFSYGQPRHLGFAKHGRPELAVTISNSDGEQTKTFELDDAMKGETRWHHASIDLAPFADRRAKFRFELRVPGDMPAYAALGSPVVFAKGEDPPTVLLITSDTHRADHLGAANSAYELQTPALDALGARGVFFERAYSSTNVTNPSHIALMTATHPRDTQIINNHVQLAAAAPTLAERFHEAGYVTYASLCAKHLGHETSGLGQGFDRMVKPRHAFTDAELAIAELEEWMPDADGRPLFVWLHVFDAHHPYGPPGEYDKLYYDKAKDPFDASLPAVTSRDENKNEVVLDTIFPPDLVGLRDLEFPKAQYKAEITYLDHELGKVFEWPRMQGALIAVTADHGECFGEHGVYYDHAGAYPQNIHVPLILAGPGVPQAVRTSHVVRQIDVGRTLLNVSGLGRAEFPGKDLLETIEDPGAADGPVYTISAHGFDASVTEGNMHLVLQLRKGQSTVLRRYEHCRVELYDLEEDPECTNDVWTSAEYREVGDRLRGKLETWVKSSKSTGWAQSSNMTPEQQAELEGLGYAGNAEILEVERVWLEDCEE